MVLNYQEQLDKLIFLCLCGYALASCVSMGAVNAFVSLTAILVIVRLMWNRTSIEIPGNFLIPLASFFIIFFLLMLISPDLDAASKRFWLFSYRMIPFIATLLFAKDNKQLKTLIILVLISVTVADIYAIWQGVHGDYRARAFGGHPMDLAGILVQCLPIFLVMGIGLIRQKTQRYLIVSALVIGTVAILFNGTRGAWITLAIVLPLAVLMYYKASKRIILYVLVAFAAFGLLLHTVPALNTRMATLADKSYQSNSERLLMWNSAWQMFVDHPLTGVGLGVYAQRYQAEYISPQAVERGQGHAHNNFLQMLAETGMVGFMAFCFMFGSFLYYSFIDWRKYQHPVSLMYFLATLGFVLQGFTEFSFGNRIVMALYFFLMAIYLQARKQYASKRIN